MDHSITKLFEVGISNVQISNGWSMGHVLCTRPTIQIPDQYIRKQDGVYLSSIKMIGLLGIQMELKNRGPFGIQPLFNHSNTKLVWHSDPQYNLK